ncbi:hypothetical protein [Pelagibius sp. Alg239-R121]|nr:hypothetical protein [Pelagibius sp. Alg239-R121]
MQIVMRPGVLRIADSFADRSEMGAAYFEQDVNRTAGFLGLSYGEPSP